MRHTADQSAVMESNLKFIILITVNVPISQVPISQNWPFSQRVFAILKICEKGQMAAFLLINCIIKNRGRLSIQRSQKNVSIFQFAWNQIATRDEY